MQIPRKMKAERAEKRGTRPKSTNEKRSENRVGFTNCPSGEKYREISRFSYPSDTQ